MTDRMSKSVHAVGHLMSSRKRVLSDELTDKNEKMSREVLLKRLPLTMYLRMDFANTEDPNDSIDHQGTLSRELPTAGSRSSQNSQCWLVKSDRSTCRCPWCFEGSPKYETHRKYGIGFD